VALRRRIWGFLRRRGQEKGGDGGSTPPQDAQITTREYRRRDRNVVLSIAQNSFGGVCIDENIEKLFGQIGGTWQEHKRDTVDYDLANNPYDTFVAEVGGRVVGFVCTRIQRNRLTGHVANMAVAPEFQGMGVGKALMAAALDHFRDCGMLYARIETLEQNTKAQKFYPSLGFKEVALQIYYFMEL